jgi:glycosyltransferase involved in cell wall biosynthesis
MRQIYIRTFAYNAEKTLRRAVDSILNQTYPYFTYYLLDNGSNDETRSIIEEYASKDRRIVPFFSDKNMVFAPEQELFIRITKTIPDNDLFCVLDADDEYDSLFFDESIKFMEKNNLDIVCCGSKWINAANCSNTGQRALGKPLIISEYNFAQQYSYYHAFLRTVWGKLIKGRCIRDFTIKRDPNDTSYPDYGIDTWDMMSGTLHNYYVTPKSGSYKLSSKRILSDRLLHEDAINYLESFGEISATNMDFLYAVYLNAINDTLNVLLNAEIVLAEKLNGVLEIFNCKYTRELAAWEDFGAQIGQAQELQRLRQEVFRAIAGWLLSLKEVPDEQTEAFCETGEYVSAAAGYADGWVLFKKLRVMSLLDQGNTAQARERLDELEELLPGDPDIAAFRAQLPE